MTPIAFDKTLLLVVHFLAAGLQTLANHRAARMNYSRLLYTYAVAATTFIFLSPVFLVMNASRNEFRGPLDDSSYLSIGMLAVLFFWQGGGYAAASYSRLRAQTVLPLHVFAPLSRLSLLLVVALSLVFLEEDRNTWKLFGIALAFIPLISLHKQTLPADRVSRFAAGLKWVILSAVVAAGLQLTSKLVVDPTYGVGLDVIAFVVGVNGANMLLSAAFLIGQKKRASRVKETLLLGTAAGGLNVLTFTTLTFYLVDGEASVIYTLSALSMVIPVAYLTVKGKEKLTRTDMASFCIALGALVILAS